MDDQEDISELYQKMKTNMHRPYVECGTKKYGWTS